MMGWEMRFKKIKRPMHGLAPNPLGPRTLTFTVLPFGITGVMYLYYTVGCANVMSGGCRAMTMMSNVHRS